MPAFRRTTGAVLALSIGFVFTGSTAALAEESGPEPGTESGATVTQTGWWWKSNDTSERPEGTDAIPSPPPPKNVPEGTLPVAAQIGEPDKMSAIQFDFDAEPGAQVSSFVVSLRESKDPGANMAADGEETSVVACKVTESYWTAGESAAWQARPDYDDIGCQEGERKANGVWTFDLTTFAMEWLGTERQTSGAIALVEDVDEPHSFQVAYEGPEKKGIGTSLTATPGAAAPAAGSGTSGEAPVDVSAGTSGAAPGPASGGVPAASSVGTDPMPQAAQAPEPPAAQAPQQPAQQPQAAGQPFMIAPSALEAVPSGVWLLAPLVLGMAYLMMLALGPAGDPNVLVARRGVSRALERLRSTGKKTVEGAR